MLGVVRDRPSFTGTVMIDPFERFTEIYERALATDVREPTAMALATATADGRPSVRMVLLKGFDRDGFVFYTNLESRKGRELTANPHAALCFHWQPLELQVRIEGSVRHVADAAADAYFASRQRGSQVGAWASLQSSPLTGRDELAERVRQIHTRFAGADIPRPPFWSGFLLTPSAIEFWSGKPDRLHERDRYVRDAEGGEWRRELLYP